MAGIAEMPKAPAAGSAPTPPEHDGLRQFAINPRHVRTLLWLRTRLTLRGYTRSARAIIGLITSLIFLALLALFLGALTGSAYLTLPRADAAQELFAAIGLLYIVWAVLPLLQYSLNEGLDVTKLQAYPLTRGEQMVSLVLATLLDLSTLVILGIFAAVIIGWHATPLATIITVVALIFAYVHIVALTQLILALLMGLLRSRRYRDITIIFFALFGFMISFGNQLLFRSGFAFGSPDAIAALHLGTYFRWTPPGMAAQAIILADQGAYVQALPWLAFSLVLIPVVLAIWARLLERGITNAESSGQGPQRRRSRRAALAVSAPAPAPSLTSVGALPAAPAAIPGGSSPLAPLATPDAVGARHVSPSGLVVRTPLGASLATPAATPTRRGLLSGAAQAIATKEIRYLWRDPQLKASLLSALFVTVIVLVPGIYGGGHRASNLSGGAWSVLLAPLPALLIVLILSLNTLGMERQGLQTLFLFPIRPLDIFWGKNLVVGGLAFGFETALVILKSVLTHDWFFAPLALVGGLAAILVMLGCGNVTSVVAPFRWRQMRMGETSSMSSENGCLRGIIQMVVMSITAILLIPVAVAIALPLILSQNAWLLITLPVAVVYGIIFYQATTRIIAPFVLRRAPEILAATVREA